MVYKILPKEAKHVGNNNNSSQNNNHIRAFRYTFSLSLEKNN